MTEREVGRSGAGVQVTSRVRRDKAKILSWKHTSLLTQRGGVE